jgi:hypothetical protein
MAAKLSTADVFISRRHQRAYFDVLFLPFNFQGLSKRHHEEEKENGSHIVSLANSNTLRQLLNFLFNFRTTTYFVYMVRTAATNFGGAPYFSSNYTKSS